jgi:uncharacterized protein
MTDVNLTALNSVVLWGTFAAAMLFGFIAHRTNFCTMGAVADVVNMGDYTRARMWALAAAVAIIGVGAFTYVGWFDPLKTIYTAPRLLWASYLVGGFMFGFGMVIASGCGSKTLVRIGAGSLKSLMVFFVLGIAAFATLKGITAVIRVNTVDTLATTLATTQDLPSLLTGVLSVPQKTLALLIALLLGGALVGWVIAKRGSYDRDVWLGGMGVGLAALAVWYVSGKVGYLAEHPETLQEAFVATNSGRAESLTFVAPLAFTLDWLMFFSDKTKVITLGIASVGGVIAGAFLNAKLTKTFRWEAFRDVEDMGNHFVGATLMGVGGVTALGCTIGQGLTGISTLSLGSFMATAALVAGCWAGLKYQIWRMERQA